MIGRSNKEQLRVAEGKIIRGFRHVFSKESCMLEIIPLNARGCSESVGCQFE